MFLSEARSKSMALGLVGVLVVGTPRLSHADVILDWAVIAANVFVQNATPPFNSARNSAVVQLAVFEAVNAITGDYTPYGRRVSAPQGASAEAAAVAAAYRVLRTYYTAAATVATLDAARAASLASIPDGPAKDNGIAVGEGAAADMLALRANDGSSPPAFFVPLPPATGVWQATPGCPVDPATGLRRGVFYHWSRVTPFAIPSASAFRPEPPPAIASHRYFMSHREVMAVGGVSSTQRPADRATVARVYAAFNPVFWVSQTARQAALERGDVLAENARNLALVAIAGNDAFIGSFEAKYHYGLWRPETAIRAGATDGNQWTDADPTFAPFVTTPCFPSYPSNHASGSGAALEMLRRLYGESGHDLSVEVPAVPGVVLRYRAFHQMLDDVSDARVYGGIHFRFDQDAGDRLGREVATFIAKEFLRPVHP